MCDKCTNQVPLSGFGMSKMWFQFGFGMPNFKYARNGVRCANLGPLSDFGIRKNLKYVWNGLFREMADLKLVYVREVMFQFGFGIAKLMKELQNLNLTSEFNQILNINWCAERKFFKRLYCFVRFQVINLKIRIINNIKSMIQVGKNLMNSIAIKINQLINSSSQILTFQNDLNSKITFQNDGNSEITFQSKINSKSDLEFESQKSSLKPVDIDTFLLENLVRNEFSKSNFDSRIRCFSLKQYGGRGLDLVARILLISFFPLFFCTDFVVMLQCLASIISMATAEQGIRILEHYLNNLDLRKMFSTVIYFNLLSVISMPFYPVSVEYYLKLELLFFINNDDVIRLI